MGQSLGHSARTPGKVAVLMGGPSAEREVSLVSGRECAAALTGQGYEVVTLDAGRDLCSRLSEIAPDVVFNALHGRFGEDGCVQGMLEWLELPYTHSGVLASAMAMDKTRSKAAFVAAGLPVMPSQLHDKPDVMAAHVMAPPYVVKPNNEGSSVGIYLVHEDANGPPALARDMPSRVLVEAFAKGRELTCAVMGASQGQPARALTVTDILTDGWYDYDAKYKPGGSRHVVPADLPAEIFDLCLEYALGAHVALGCRGLSRTDFRWDESRGRDGLILLETNTQPGMTPTSLGPEQAAAVGMDFAALCHWLIKDASCKR